MLVFPVFAGPMIVSASYRTDIPACYGDWFSRRLADGQCLTVNPWNGQVQAIDLSPEAVDGFVFWTRNLRPFFDSLPTVRKRAPFVVQYTVTGYPHALEASVVPAARAIADIRSEEHTSELQSLMRIPYAVFCLNKKKKHT